MDEARSRDPYPRFKAQLLEMGYTAATLDEIEAKAKTKVQADFERALEAEDPRPEDLFTHDFAPTLITEEIGDRQPDGGEEVVMVDCALHTVEELMKEEK